MAGILAPVDENGNLITHTSLLRLLIEPGPYPLAPKAQTLIQTDGRYIADPHLQGAGLNFVNGSLLQQMLHHFSADALPPCPGGYRDICDLSLARQISDSAASNDLPRFLCHIVVSVVSLDHFQKIRRRPGHGKALPLDPADRFHIRPRHLPDCHSRSLFSRSAWDSRR